MPSNRGEDVTTSVPERKFRILSIDGGGIRGIIPAAILVSLESTLRSHSGKPDLKIGECFDLIAGTSTGGIIACHLLAPSVDDPTRPMYSATDTLSMYMDWGGDIFDKYSLQAINSLGGLRDERYSAKPLESVLQRHFGNLRLSQFIRPSLITSFDTKNYRPFFFTSEEAKKDPDSDFYIREVARATSAAPTYFEIALADSLKEQSNARPMIDGGVFANNPAMCAYVEAYKIQKLKMDSPGKCVILSLGTGGQHREILYQQARNWGILDWARPLLEILFEGVSQTVDYQLKNLFEAANCSSQYLRINEILTPEINPEMDAADGANLTSLKAFGQKLAQDRSAELNTFAKFLL